MRRHDPVLLAGVGLILLQTVVRAAIVLPSYYWQDDFVHMELAGRLGLSREFLLRDHNDHLGIGPSLVYWLLGRDASLSFLPAALCLLVLQLAASCLLLAVLRQLFGRSPWLLVPFAGYLFTPLGLPVATWWAAGLEALPLQIGMLAALLGLVRALRERSWRWAAFSVGGHALGLLFYEKSLLILPAVVAVLVLVEWADEPLERRLRLLTGAWRYFLPHGLLIAAYAPLYVSVVDSDAGLGLEPGSVIPSVGETVFRMLLPGIFGGPWTDAGAQNTIMPRPPLALAVLFGLLAVAVVAASVWLRGRRAAQGWLLVGSYVAVDLALVQLARSQFLDLVARDPRYLTDALPIIAIGAAAALTGPLVDRPVPPWAARVAGSTRSALVGGAVLVASCLVTTALVADGLQHRESRDYVRAVLQAMDDNPAASVLNTGTSYDVNIFQYPDLEGVLRSLGQEREFDQPGTDVRMFDGEGNLQPITLITTRLQAAGPVPNCGWPVAAQWQRLADLPGSGFELLVLQVDYGTPVAATLQLAVGEDEQTLALPPGLGRATFVVTAQSGPIRVRVPTAPFGGFCVSEIAVGAPWPADDP